MQTRRQAVLTFLLFASLLAAPAALSLGQEAAPPAAPEAVPPGVREFGQAQADEARDQARQHIEEMRARMDAMRPAGPRAGGPAFGRPGFGGPPGPAGFGPPGLGPNGPGLPQGELVSGTRVRLLPPPGFTLSDEFFGLNHAETGSRVVVSEIPVALAEAPLADDATYAKGGVTILDRQNVKVAGQDGVLLEAKQTMAGEVIRKWILYFGDDQRTVMLVGAYRAGQEQIFREALRFCLLNAKIDPNAQIDPAAQMTLGGEATGKGPSAKKPTLSVAANTEEAAPAEGAATSNEAAAAASPTGSRVSLTPPPGFVASKLFVGYQQDSTDASIVINEVPGPFSVISSASAAEFAKNGMTIKQRRDVNIGNLSGLLIAASQTAAGQTFNKWILIFGDEKETVLITANFPDKHRELVSPLRTSLLGAKFDRARKIDPFSDVDFTLTLGDGFTSAGKLQNVLMFVQPAADPQKLVSVFIAGKTLRVQAEGADRRQFAEIHLTENPAIVDLKIESTEPITIDGLEGFETLATAKAKQGGAPVFLHMVALFVPDGQDYYLMQAQAGLAERDATTATFQTMTRSFKRKK